MRIIAIFNRIPVECRAHRVAERTVSSDLRLLLFFLPLISQCWLDRFRVPKFSIIATVTIPLLHMVHIQVVSPSSRLTSFYFGSSSTDVA